MLGFMRGVYHVGHGLCNPLSCGILCVNGAEPSELVDGRCRSGSGGSPTLPRVLAWGVGGPFLESDPAGFIPVGPGADAPRN